MRTLWYPGRSWWPLGLADVEDGEKQMVLRDILGDKIKGLELPWYPLLLYLLADAYSLFWDKLPPSQVFILSRIFQIKLYRSPMSFCTTDTIENILPKVKESWACTWTKGKDLVEKTTVTISKRRGHRESVVPKEERAMESGTQWRVSLGSDETSSPALPLGWIKLGSSDPMPETRPVVTSSS